MLSRDWCHALMTSEDARGLPSSGKSSVLILGAPPATRCDTRAMTPAAPAVRRLLVVVGTLLLAVTGVTVTGVLSATGDTFPAPTPRADVRARRPSGDLDPGAGAAGRLRLRPVPARVPLQHPAGRARGDHRRLQGAALHRPSRQHLRLLRLHAVVPQGHPDERRGGSRRGGARHEPSAPAAAYHHAGVPGDAEPARVVGAEPQARDPRRHAGQCVHQHRDARPVRRAHQLPQAEAALLHADRDPGPRERLLARTAARSTPPAPEPRRSWRSTSPSRPGRSRSSASSG